MAKTAHSEMNDISTMGEQEDSRWSETVKSDDSSDIEQRMPSNAPSGRNQPHCLVLYQEFEVKETQP